MLHFTFTAARTRSFSDHKLNKLYSSPAIISDRSAFVEWMNNLTNEILGLSDIEVETSQLIAAAASSQENEQHAIRTTDVSGVFINNSHLRPEPFKPSLDMIRSLHRNIFVADGTHHQSDSVAAGVLSSSSNIQVTSVEQISVENLLRNVLRNHCVDTNDPSKDEAHTEYKAATELPTRMSLLAPSYLDSDDSKDQSRRRNEDLLERMDDTMPVHLACNVYSEVDDSSFIQSVNIDVKEIAVEESAPERGQILLCKLGPESLHDESDGIFGCEAESCLIKLRSSSISSASDSSINTSHSYRECDLAASTIDAVLETAIINDADGIMLDEGQIELCNEVDLSGHWQSSGKGTSTMRADYSPPSVFSSKKVNFCQEHWKVRSESNLGSSTMETKGLPSFPYLRRVIVSASEANGPKNEEFYMSGSNINLPPSVAMVRSPHEVECCSDTVGYSTLGKSVDLSRITFQVSNY